MNDCCADPGNRKDGPGPRGIVGLEATVGRDDTQVIHCTVCECRHVEAAADPGSLGLVGAGL